MRHVLWVAILATALAGANASTHAANLPKGCQAVLSMVKKLTREVEAQQSITNAITTEIAKLTRLSWAAGYCRALSSNIASKLESKKEGVVFTIPYLISTAVEYEAFRITSFRNSGVSPKRYFGFLDEVGRAAAYEKKLKTVASRVAPMLNAYALKKKLGFTVTPKEIVVTHISEGGALLLSTQFDKINQIHPVYGVGLDDYRLGLVDLADLVREIDTAFKTRLAIIARPKSRFAIFARQKDLAMTFEESVLGTAVMYLWEKNIAERKRKAEGRPPLRSLSLDAQFVHASLVYNSGILFSEERVRQIMAFSTGDYLFEVSEKTARKSRRPLLPVMRPVSADALLERGEPLPNQPTSWNAVYHILQRYGAWVALGKFTNTFTPDGAIRKLRINSE